MFARIALFFLFFAVQCLEAQVMSPEEFMPHQYGEEFTPHHRLVAYFYHVAQESDIVAVAEYGRTNQHRPLIYAVVTSKSNHKNLEQIRLNNLRQVGMESGSADKALNKSIVWLSFGVHGNEAGASESSMQSIYELVTGGKKATDKWLENTVVIIDPCINPDGYNRYTHWNINTNASYKNPTRADNEHKEPWPSGRVNHFHHDLNRDWAWASQIETKHRLKIYHQWLPHIHADFHEMYPGSPYYFPPAAEPLHDYVSDFQRHFQTTIGKNHARHFDEENWLYYTREDFDLFYPSYGDTYPMFNGAIGMTYEQAGHGIAGRAILLNNGDTLELQDRIDHHVKTALSTVEAASADQELLTSSFYEYYQNAQEKVNGKYSTYIIRNDGSEELKSFLALLDLHHIRYKMTNGSSNVNGYVFRKFSNGRFDYNENDVVIQVKQPHGIMAQVLLEPKSLLTDSVTYDITSWSLLMAYGLNAVATEKEVGAKAFEQPSSMSNEIEDGYAFAIPYKGWKTGKFLSHLHRNQVSFRVAQKGFTNSGVSFKKGSIIVAKADNKNKDLNTILQDNHGAKIVALQTGFSSDGPDIGSDKMKLVSQPKILLVGGEGTDAYNYGQIWQYVDQDLSVAYTTVLESDFNKIQLSDYNTIILPEGYYPNLSEGRIARLIKWVRDGGKLIAFGSAISAISGEKAFSINLKKQQEADEVDSSTTGDHKLERFENAFRKRVSNWMPGAIVKLQIDDSHPLGFGMGNSYASLKLSSSIIPYQDDTWNVGYIDGDLQYTGFIGANAKEKLEKSTTFFVKEMGGGQVVGLIDNPLYRSFWYKGKQLLYNAIYMVN